MVVVAVVVVPLLVWFGLFAWGFFCWGSGTGGGVLLFVFALLYNVISRDW